MSKKKFFLRFRELVGVVCCMLHLFDVKYFTCNKFYRKVFYSEDIFNYLE